MYCINIRNPQTVKVQRTKHLLQFERSPSKRPKCSTNNPPQALLIFIFTYKVKSLLKIDTDTVLYLALVRQ